MTAIPAIRNWIVFDLMRDVADSVERLIRKIVEQCESALSRIATGAPAKSEMNGDDANQESHDWWKMMTLLRQNMLNLLAAGLFHLVEQQLCAVVQRRDVRRTCGRY